MQLVGNAHGFAWQQHALTRGLLHDGGRVLGWAVAALLLLNVWRPLFGGLTRAERVRWLLVTLPAWPWCRRSSSSATPAAPGTWPNSVAASPATCRTGSWACSTAGRGAASPRAMPRRRSRFIGGWFVLRGRHPALRAAWLAAVLDQICTRVPSSTTALSGSLKNSATPPALRLIAANSRSRQFAHAATPAWAPRSRG
jgi:hypothetical protein